MAEEVEGNVRFTIDASQALATLRNLQKQLAVFHTSMAQAGAGSSNEALKLKQNLLNAVNATGSFSASMVKVKSSTEAFTHALENNKMSMGEYFRYAGGATKSFGKLFKTEFSQIQQVAESRVKTLQTRFIAMGRDANGALQAIKIRPLTLDMKDLTTQQMIAAQKQQLFNQLIKQGSTQMLNWGKNTQWAGRQLMVGFTIPITMFASAAAKAYMEIEKQTIAFKRVYGDFQTTTEQTNQMADAIKNLAKEFTQYGVAIADTMDLAAKSAAMGKVGADLQAQVKETTRLAVLGGVDQQQALETTISLTNAFGVASDQLAGKIDFLNAVENQTVTSIADLTEAIPKAGPVVQQLGGNVEDLTFFLTAMREGGINASEGANALKSGLAAIINPTGKAAEMLKGFGINIQGIVDANKGDVKGLVIDFAKALDQLDPLNRAKAIEQLFGKFQFSRISTLFQNVIKEGSQAQQVLKLTNASTAELAALSKRELSKLSESPVYKFEKAMADFQASLAPIGEEFLKAVTPLIEFGTDLLKKFDELSDSSKQIGIYIAAGLGVVGPVFLMITGLVANGIANLIKFGSAISSVFTKLKGGTGDAAMSSQYLTQAQLAELAATADLDAAHSKLKATLSSETGAVNALAAAYRDAAKAQAQLAGYDKRTGKFMPAQKRSAKKYAGGVVSVPGPKGAGDVVPAMLSPGEAVIPAGMAKKYGGLINGMISGNVPGYSEGKPVGISDAIRNKELQRAPEVIRKQTRAMVWDSLEAEMKAARAAAKKANPNVTDKQLLALTLKNASHMKEDTESIDFAGEKGNVKRWRAKNIMPDLGAVNNYLQTVKTSKRIIPDFLKNVDSVAKELGMTAKEVRAEATKIAKGDHPTTRSGAKVLSAIARSDVNTPAYRTAAASAVIDARLKGNYYETMDQRRYDPAMDAKAEAIRLRKIEELKAEREKLKGTPSAPTSTAKTQGGISAKNNLGISDARKVETRIDKNGNPRYFLNGKQIPSAVGEAAVAKVEKADTRNAQARTARANRPAPVEPVPMTRGEKFSAGVRGMGSKIAGGIRSMGPMGGMIAMGAVGAGVGMIPGMEGFGTAIATIGPMLMMLPGPIAGVVAAMALLGGGIFALVQAQEEQKKKAIELANSMSMTSTKLASISEVTGTISATEARKANQAANVAGPQSSRQLAFGESFLESDPGKAMVADIATQRTAGKSSTEIAKNIATQLGIAVAQGVVTADQARSIAINLGKELKDYRVGVQIEGNIVTLLGPNGENLKNNPLQVALEINKSNMEQQAALFNAAVQPYNAAQARYSANAPGAGQDFFTLLGNALSMSSTGGGLTTATAIEQRQAAPGIMASMGVGIEAYSTSQQMLDVLNKQYDARLESAKQNVEDAKTEKEKLAAATELANVEFERGNALKQAQASSRNILETMIKQSSSVDPTLFTDTLKASVDALYKDTAMAPAATKALESINALQGTSTFKTTLQLQFASGELDPITASLLLDSAANNKDFSSNYTVLTTAVGDAKTIELMQKIAATGGNAETLNVVLKTVSDNPEQLQSTLDALSVFQNLQAKGGVSVDINTSGGQEQLNKTVSIIEQLKKEDKITIDVIQKVTGSKAIATALKNNKDFMKLPKNQKISYAATYTATMNLEGDPSMQTAYRNWQSTQPVGADVSFPSFAKYLAGIQAAATAAADTSGTTDTTPSTTGGGGGSGEDKKLARLNKQLDKRQKALAVISLLEDKINKRYDERAKALQKIAEINNKVAQAQRDQLSIANALATGDIAAAAMAVQDARENAAAKAAQDQVDALEAARKRELDAVSFAGQNRKTLEEEISRLELLIAKREYKLSGKSTGGGGGGGSSTTSSKTKNMPPSPAARPTGYVEGGAKEVGVRPNGFNPANFKFQDGVWKNIQTGLTMTTSAYGAAMDKFKASSSEYGANIAAASKALQNGGMLSKDSMDKLLPSFSSVVQGIQSQTSANLGLKDNQDLLAAKLTEMGYKVKDGKVLIETAAGQVKIPLANVAGYINDVKSNAKNAAGPILTVAQRLWQTNRAAGKTNGGPFPVATGGLITKMGPIYRAGGGIVPNYLAAGGFAMGTDTVPAMLTPGEFVVSRPAVRNFGVENLKAINNNGSVGTGSVYNYSVTVNAQTGANADQIASTVLAKIKQVESQRIKGNRY